MGGVLSRDAAWAIVHLTLLFGCCSATQLISSKHSKHISKSKKSMLMCERRVACNRVREYFLESFGIPSPGLDSDPDSKAFILFYGG